MKDLAQKRYKLIADYPTNSDSVNTIYESDKNGNYGISIPDYFPINSAYLDKYPANFKQLGWWEERTPEELCAVEFVKILECGSIEKVISFEPGYGELLLFRLESGSYPSHTILPASFLEYSEYKTKIEK